MAILLLKSRTIPAKLRKHAAMTGIQPIKPCARIAPSSCPTAARHSRAVAEVAAFLAARTAQQGVPVDRRLAESAALLHDADKALPPDDPLRIG